MKKITEIAKKISLSEDDIELYGKYKAKISSIDKFKNNKDGNLILVTSINPTPYGEGKTTITIGLGQALNKINKKVVLALREPSLGPCFGMKGGATGGGQSSMFPSNDINLHFTGDIHAMTTANNLTSALIDNHINFGNKLNIKKVVWKRALDLNDRALRNIIVGVGDNAGKIREDSFQITVASEIMAIMCLAENLQDLRKRLENIIIAYDTNNKQITLKDIEGVGAVLALLKDALKPNLVQTTEGVPVLVHGGPFANIAHGCNSVIATKTALKLGDYVITEAGFGADLGAEKFLDIKCRQANLKPKMAVIVTTCRSLKYNGGAKDFEIENIDALQKGIVNLNRHIENIKKYNLPIIVALNKFNFDTENEINFIKENCQKLGVEMSICEAFTKGGEGCIDLANKVVNTIDNLKENNFNYLYQDNLTIKEKIEKIATEIYRAKQVIFSPEAKKKLKKYEEYNNLPVCIAKTQYSFSDNPDLLGAPVDFDFHINDINLSNGAGFVVALSGTILTMPALPKVPASVNVDVNEEGEIVGL